MDHPNSLADLYMVELVVDKARLAIAQRHMADGAHPSMAWAFADRECPRGWVREAIEREERRLRSEGMHV